MTTIRYNSHQDFATKMARISAILLQTNLAWKYENFRSDYNDQDDQFRMHLHKAMGWRASTVNDWNG